MPTLSPARLIAVKEIPSGTGWLYEPKLDGYRGLLVSNAKRAGSVWSRNAKDLGRFFPELADLAARLPADSALDGEILLYYFESWCSQCAYTLGRDGKGAQLRSSAKVLWSFGGVLKLGKSC